MGFNKFIEKWGISASEDDAAAEEVPHMLKRDAASYDELCTAVAEAELVAVCAGDNMDSIEICDGKTVYNVHWSSLGDDYDKLLKLIFSADVKKVSHNVKELMCRLMVEGLPLDGFVYDTALAAYLLDATENDYDLRRISMRYCGVELIGAEAIYRLKPATEEKLKELEMERLYYEIELPLCRVLAQMQASGFMVDKMALSSFGDSLVSSIDALRDEIYELAGGEFNINSPKQLGEVLLSALCCRQGKRQRPAGVRTRTSLKSCAESTR